MQLTKKIKAEFVDERGGITKILDDGKTNIKSVLWITSKAGTIRSNHYHKKDTHYLYVVSGEMAYYEKPVGGKGKPKKVTVKAGDMVFSPSMAIHATKFLQDTVLLALSTKSRNQKAYEKDTVRIKLIS